MRPGAADVDADLAGCEIGDDMTGRRAVAGRRLESQKRLRRDGGRVESIEAGGKGRLGGADRVTCWL